MRAAGAGEQQPWPVTSWERIQVADMSLLWRGGVGIKGIEIEYIEYPNKEGMAGMKVKDIMTVNVSTLKVDEELRLADDIMKLERIRHLPIIDGETVVGIISQRDLFKASLGSAMGFGEEVRRDFLETVIVKDIMTKEVITIDPEADLKEAGRIMLEKKIGCLPVVKDNILAGVITETDILKYFVSM